VIASNFKEIVPEKVFRGIYIRIEEFSYIKICGVRFALNEQQNFVM